MKRIVSILVLATLVGFGVGCTDKTGQAALAEMKTQAELEARNIDVIKTLTAELDKGNADAFQKYYAPDAKYYFPSNSPTPMSRDDEVAMFKMMKTAIPDLTHQVTDIFAVRDRVILRSVVRGTHKAELEGIPATGSTISAGTICIFRLKDGVVMEEIQDADMLGFYQQLGMELKPKTAAK